MFEKEAEEYVIEKHNIDITKQPVDFALRCEFAEDFTDFQKGAEFSYNKANEWHYVKDELPPARKEYCGRSEPVLVVSKKKEMQYAQYVEKEKTWARGICAIGFEPYAWKEIVLPKEMKE